MMNLPGALSINSDRHGTKLLCRLSGFSIGQGPVSIAGHLDALCIDTECCEYFSEFLGGQRCLEALTKQLLGPRTFVPCMLSDERLDLFLARRTKQIPDKEETAWP